MAMHMEVCACDNCGESLQEAGRTGLCENCDIDIISRDVAEATGEIWIETAAYSLCLRGHGTEIIRKSDARQVLLQGDEAVQFGTEMEEIDSSEPFNEACGKLFSTANGHDLADGSADMTLKVSQREFNTILAALRFWQRAGNTGSEEEYTIANDTGEQFDRDDSLGDNEIDTLCERLNCE